jgi:pilus assembly protein CpaF
MSFEIILPFLRPIEALLFDERTTEIMCNPDSTCWIERDGRIAPAPDIRFETGELHAGLEVIANKFGKQLNADRPILNARLPDGSRLAAMVPPIVSPEPLLNIRKFSKRNFTFAELVAAGTLTERIATELRSGIQNRYNLLISGATGTGKTTLLNTLASAIPEDERVFVIEDTAEIRITKPHVISAEAQTHTHKQEITFDELLKAALRHRPDRLILGEIRGAEARTLLDAMNTGHRGTLTTIHANSAQDAMKRLASLAARGVHSLRLDEAREEVRDSVQIVAHMERRDGIRAVVEFINLKDQYYMSLTDKPTL